MSDDERPIERSARKPPQKKVSNELLAVLPKKHRAVDPRFDPMYGSINEQQFKQNYKFLEDQRQDEQSRRRIKIRRLNTILRRLRAEKEAEANGEEVDGDYNFSEDEEEVFLRDIDEGDVASRSEALGELRRMKRTPMHRLERELLEVQRESTLYQSQVGDSKAKSRVADVKKSIMKAEVKAVKEGTKNKPFFLKRGDLKRRVAEDKFEELNQKGGKNLVDKYMERKRKR